MIRGSLLFISTIIVLAILTPVVHATNKSSFLFGYQAGLTPGSPTSAATHTPPINYNRQVLVPTTPSGEGLTPVSNKSVIYNSGFSQGYLGFPLKGHHTSEFLAAYANGTSLYWFNRGDTEGYNGLNPTSSEKNNSDYMKGWKQGRDTFKDIGPDKGFESIPINTDDNYLDYYVGQYNSAVAADRDNSSNGPGDGTHNHCGSGHTQEYCLGYTTGYQAESYLLNDA